MRESTNKRIGGFEITRELPGAGGDQGRIYVASCVEPCFADVAIGASVALKVMPVQDADGQLLKRLEKRTELLASIRHPNIVRYFGCFSEAGSFNDLHVVVMEFLRGCTLKESIEQTPHGLDADVALQRIRDALSGLSYAAQRGIIHRDIKPGNIFVCEDGTVKLIDFEIARQEGGTLTVSSQGNLRGTFDYMAPDFIEPDFHGDECSDVFSLAVCLHEALCGKTPYERVVGNLQQATFVFHSRWNRGEGASAEGAIRISSRIRRLVAHLEKVLSKGLSPNRNERFQTFEEFREAMKDAKPHEILNGQEQYQILQFIGSGGFGEVFKARHVNNGRLVAVKHLMKGAYADRFIREAKLLKRLSDSRFVQFVDFFTTNQTGSVEGFLVMDMLPDMPGSSLRDRLRKNRQGLAFDEAVQAFIRYSEGLAIMHRAAVYHRDIKPSNLYLPQGHPEAACIMDLGIARDAHGSLTHGQVPGTLDYMPPEVAFGDSRGDAGMDIYALGLCFYEALTGKTAFPRLPLGDAAIPTFLQRAKDKPSPTFDQPVVLENPMLGRLLIKMTDPDVSRREQDANQVAAALKALLFPDAAESQAIPQADHEPSSQKVPIKDLEVLSSPHVPAPTPDRASVRDNDDLAEQEPATLATVAFIPDGKRNSNDDPVADGETLPADVTLGTQIAPQDLKELLIAKTARKRTEHKRMVLPPMFWQALKKLAVGLFVLAILVAAGWAGWLYRADVLQVTNNAIQSSADSIHAIRFNRKTAQCWVALDGIKRLRSEGLSPDKYIQITNQIATAKFKMEQDLESSFGTFLKPPRKANVKPNEGLRALKDGYDELVENVKKDFVVQAEKAKAAVIEAYRAHNMEEGDNKFRTWKQWAVFLESEKASRDLWEIQTLQVGLVDSYKEAALGEYAALRLEKGDEQQHTWLKLVEEHDNKPKPSELSELAAARTACIVARARSLFDQSCQAYQGDDLETGDKQRDVWLDQLKGAGREPDQAAVGQIAKARTACLERVAQHLFDQSFQAYRSDKLEVGHGFHAKWKELDVPRKRADEEKLTSEEVACKKRLEVEKTTIEQKAFALTALEKAIESAKNRLNAEDVKKIRPEQTALRTAIDAAQKFSLNTEEARAVAEQLAQRIGALTQAVPITLAQGALLDPAVVTEWSVDNEHWQVWTPAVKVEPGQVWVRFLRNDYERQGPKALAVEPVKGCLVAVPEARAWQAGEALTRLNNLRAWVRDKEWVRASAYTNDMRIGLVDPKHRQDWEVLVKGVVGHFDQIKDKRDQQGKAAALVASLSALKTELENNKTDGFAKFVWPCPEKNIAGLPQVVAAGNEFASVLSNWVVTVACVDDPLASRQARLSEAAGVLGASAVVNLLGTAVSESLEKRVATARAVFILRLENESGLVSSVLVNGKDEVLAVGGRRDLRLAAKPASLVARVPGYEDQFLGVNWTAGGGQKVSVKPFVMAPLSVELVGETLGVLPFIKPLLVDDNGKTVMNQFGRCTLAPGLYTLTLSRADYQTQVQKIVLKAGDQQVRVKGGVWVPTVALQGLMDAEQAYRAQQYDVSAAHLSVGGQLEDVGHQEKKRNLEASVVAEYKRITSKYADACRDECFKQLCLQLPFKQAATELVLPDSPKIPEWVLQRFDKQTKDMLEKKGILTAEQENILKKAKDASVYFNELDPSAFNDTPINELAEAVKSGFKPSPEYVKLAENAFAQCQQKLKDLEKIGGPVVKITREKCKIAEDNLKIIQKAMSL